MAVILSRAALLAALRSDSSATAVLERMTGHTATITPLPHTEPATNDVLDALHLSDIGMIRHRRVRLELGGAAYSDADLWYVPERLPADIRATLADGVTPFGRAVLMLGPVRKTLHIATPDTGEHALIIHAVLYDRAIPIAYAAERYRRALIALP
jgi:chorismate-pyruvate lyase